MFSCQVITVNDCPNLFHLIRFCLGLLWLKVQNLRDVIARENMMITSDTLHKPQMLEQATKVEKRDIRVRSPTEHGIQDLLLFRHPTIVLRFRRKVNSDSPKGRLKPAQAELRSPAPATLRRPGETDEDKPSVEPLTGQHTGTQARPKQIRDGLRASAPGKRRCAA